MSATYDQLAALPAAAYLNPENFATPMDGYNRDYALRQARKGQEIANSAKEITIAINSVWGAVLADGANLSSYEGIGYHANTAELLSGFLAGHAQIIVYRNTPDGITSTTIKPYID